MTLVDANPKPRHNKSAALSSKQLVGKERTPTQAALEHAVRVRWAHRQPTVLGKPSQRSIDLERSLRLLLDCVKVVTDEQFIALEFADLDVLRAIHPLILWVRGVHPR